MSGADASNGLILAVQRGVPLSVRPFADMSAAMGLTEAEVLQAVRDLFEKGIARRFGAVFDSRSLGYGSTLCAVDVPEGDLQRVADRLAPHSGVTHCYERDGHPNLWFTMTAPAALLQNELRALSEMLAPFTLLDLPALRRFKVQVVLDTSGAGGAAEERPPLAERGAGSIQDWPEHHKAVVRALQGNIPLTAEPFTHIADSLDWDVHELLALLADWRQRGILRRVGVILRHREAGFAANGMCVWRVAEEDIERAGGALAACPEVTHCYQRPFSDAFAYNLFAMVHARRREEARDIFLRLSGRASLEGGKMLMSLREFKKSSPVFFSEDSGAAEGEQI